MSTQAKVQTESEAAQPELNRWPALPYKALKFYVQEDAPLFAGRDRDIFECANLLCLTSTRILILHGKTGCGKSSFLRAGLIPFLESGGSGFQFLKEVRDNKIQPIFVRSTDCPLVTLAREVYNFAEKDIHVQTPLGPHTLKLSKVLSDYEDRNDFLEKAGTNPDLMVEVLNEIARILPRTLVLIIDQAEEVLTLKQGPEGDEYRDQFFQFMALFSNTQYDLKLLVALRTEYYGLFNNAIRQRALDISNVRDYVLDDFVREQIIEAIKRPTSDENIPSYGKAHDHYKFEYAGGLPEKIADDLESLMKAGNPSGGILPVVQVVCDRLYQRTKLKLQQNAPWVITKEDYRNLGGIAEQIGEYLRAVLVDRCKEKGISELEIINETTRWRDVLSELAKSQADGTVTTEVIREDDLKTVAEKVKCKLDFKETMDYLSDDDRRILRYVETIDLTTDKTVQCYSLGHDAIGLVLRRWKITRQEAKATLERRERKERHILYMAVFQEVYGVLLFIFARWKNISYLKWLGIFMMIYGLAFTIALFGMRNASPRLPYWLLAATVRLLPGLSRQRFITDSVYRERLRQYPELSEKFESYLTQSQ